MPPVHVVWDWNGTLLDDLDVVIDSVNRSIARYGMDPIDVDAYRDHCRRPVRSFYDSLFGRVVDDMEWEDLNKTFHELYLGAVDQACLAPDAVTALEGLRAMGCSQSLLSMSTHSELKRLVDRHGIDGYFQLVSGLPSPSGDLKVGHLRAHLGAAGIVASEVVVIGDTPDDHHAAFDVGARSVAFDGGSHHRKVLDELGVPVADSLLAVVGLVETWLAA